MRKSFIVQYIDKEGNIKSYAFLRESSAISFKEKMERENPDIEFVMQEIELKSKGGENIPKENESNNEGGN